MQGGGGPGAPSGKTTQSPSGPRRLAGPVDEATAWDSVPAGPAAAPARASALAARVGDADGARGWVGPGRGVGRRERGSRRAGREGPGRGPTVVCDRRAGGRLSCQRLRLGRRSPPLSRAGGPLRPRPWPDRRRPPASTHPCGLGKCSSVPPTPSSLPLLVGDVSTAPPLLWAAGCVGARLRE